MKKLNHIISFVIILLLFNCYNKEEVNSLEVKIIPTKQDSINFVEVKEKASIYGMFSQEYQTFLDILLKTDSKNAGLWQQKAMPLFKSKKYELGMLYLNKAVEINPEEYLSYRAFIKCIFSKQYKESIQDFNKLKTEYGDSHVMDHTYDFYLGLCYLQLNDFEKANQYLKESYKKELENFTEDWVSPIDSFYLGISYLEINECELAISNFDKALKSYSTFGDAYFYKYMCLLKLNKIKEAKESLKLAYLNILEGNTINETNSIYEKYPYKVYKDQIEYLIVNN